MLLHSCFSTYALPTRIAGIGLLIASSLIAQEQAPQPQPPSQAAAERPTLEKELAGTDGGKTAPAPAPSNLFEVETGTRIPLTMVNSISTKTASENEPVYLETVFPIVVRGKVVIPPGSYVKGTVTHVKRPGRVKGKGEFYLRFDKLTLPNGTERDFRASLKGLDGRSSESLDKKEGKISSEGDKAGDINKAAQVTMAGMGVGALGGQAAGNLGRGTMIGAAAGGAVGLGMMLLSRGPDAVLAPGTIIELVTDRPIQFESTELDFSNSMQRANRVGSGPLPSRRANTTGTGFPGRLPY